MSFALIEVEATAKKAARGAGHSWGMAEEAARAARWLCAHGIDGVAGLARALARVDGSDPRQHAPARLAVEPAAEPRLSDLPTCPACHLKRSSWASPSGGRSG